MQLCPFGGLREAAAFSETSSVAGVGGESERSRLSAAGSSRVEADGPVGLLGVSACTQARTCLTEMT